MAKSNDNWFNRRIDPLPKDDSRDVEAIREQLQALHDQHDSGATAKPPERLIDTFWRQHGHKQDQEGAWHVFYSGLTSQQKQQLWDEYHQIVSDSSAAEAPLAHKTTSQPVEAPEQQFATFQANEQPEPKPTSQQQTHKKQSTPDSSKKQELLKKLKDAKGERSMSYHMKPLISAVLVMTLFGLLNYNQLVIAQVRQYVSPGDSLQSPAIIDPNTTIEISDEPRIIIPKINVDVPVVYDVNTYQEDAIQAGLERGVVHYHNTALPGQAGNNVIVGHSSNNFLNSGKYKFAFVLLSKLELGDTFILHYEGTRYIYKVTNKQVIEPTDFSLVQPTAVPTATLITCDPPGTNWRRLVIQGEQITPDPTENQPSQQQITPETETDVVPGNAPSFFERIQGWLFGD